MTDKFREDSSGVKLKSHLQDHLQKAMKLAVRAAMGMAVASLCLLAPGPRAATRHAKLAKKHVVHAKKKPVSHAKKAGVQRVSYGYKKAAVRRRRYVRRRRWRHHITLPRRPSRDRTEEIQAALARGGYYSGEPNGKWDSRMSAALERFQTANGITPTGKLDALSLQKMGLGSNIAGVSAPRIMTPGNPDADSSAASSKPAPKAPGI